MSSCNLYSGGGLDVGFPENLFMFKIKSESTVLVLRMAHRKLKEFKQQPSMLPGSAVPGSCLVSFYILWAILSTSTVINLN